MTTVLRNTNPISPVDLPLIGRTLELGETFEVEDYLAGTEPTPAVLDETTGAEITPADPGSGLLAQAGNYERVVPAGDGLEDRTIAELTGIAGDAGVDLTGVTLKADIIAKIREKG